MWPFTGHCVYSLDCDRWKTGCGHCPYPEMPNAIRRDATRVEWKLKEWSYLHSNMTFVAPSAWMYKLAQQSMLHQLKIHHIPYGLDTETYQPLDPEMSRVALGIPPRKRVLLYMVRRMNPSHKTSYIKGADVLAEAISNLPTALRRQTVLLLVGEGATDYARNIDIETVPLGFVSSDRLKCLAYSAADLFVFPTRADNLPLVLMESMACGTPAVSFKVGGVPDLVRPGVTGLLAEPQNPKELAERIVELLDDESLRARLGQQCRTIVEQEYSLDLYIQRHLALYRQAIDSMAA